MHTSAGPIVTRPGNCQRLRDALAGRFTGEVPFLEIYVAEEIVNRVMGRPMGTHMIVLPPAEYVEFLERTGMDAAYLYTGWFLGRKTKTDEHGRVHYVDGTVKSRRDFDQIVLPPLSAVTNRIESFLEAARGTQLGAMYALDLAPTLALTAIGPYIPRIAVFSVISATKASLQSSVHANSFTDSSTW